MTTIEAAKYLGVDTSTVRRLIRKGIFRAVKVTITKKIITILEISTFDIDENELKSYNENRQAKGRPRKKA